jgi:hypothetical protein
MLKQIQDQTYIEQLGIILGCQVIDIHIIGLYFVCVFCSETPFLLNVFVNTILNMVTKEFSKSLLIFIFGVPQRACHTLGSNQEVISSKTLI